MRNRSHRGNAKGIPRRGQDHTVVGAAPTRAAMGWGLGSRPIGTGTCSRGLVRDSPTGSTRPTGMQPRPAWPTCGRYAT